MWLHNALFMDENIPSVDQAPWFPNLRLHPALINPEGAQKIVSGEPQVLLAMPCPPRKILVVSKTSIHIYEIPRNWVNHEKKEGLGVAALKFGLGFVPVVDELLEASEKVAGVAGWVKHHAFGGAKKEREEDLELVMRYKDMYLLTNIFKWKETFQASLLRSNQSIFITVDGSGMTIEADGKKAFVPSLSEGWDPLKIAKDIIERNHQALEAAGWSAQDLSRGYVLKKN